MVDKILTRLSLVYNFYGLGALSFYILYLSSVRQQHKDFKKISDVFTTKNYNTRSISIETLCFASYSIDTYQSIYIFDSVQT